MTAACLLLVAAFLIVPDLSEADTEFHPYAAEAPDYNPKWNALARQRRPVPPPGVSRRKPEPRPNYRAEEHGGDMGAVQHRPLSNLQAPSSEPEFRYQRVPPVVGVRNQRVPPVLGVRNQRVPPVLGVRNQRVPPVVGVRNQRVPPVLGVRNQRVPPVVGVRNQRVPPVVGVRNQRVPPVVGVRNQRVPPVLGVRAQHPPPAAELHNQPPHPPTRKHPVLKYRFPPGVAHREPSHDNFRG